jgi:hypothetical protein
MVFYQALQIPAPKNAWLKVPIVDLELNGAVVLASGTAVLSIIVLAIVGSMRALKRARDVGLGERTGEEFDIYPNAIDLAFYALPGSHKFFVNLAHDVYLLVLLLGLVEAAWLWVGIVQVRATAWPMFAAVGALLWARAVWLMIPAWYQRIRDLPHSWRTRF